MEELIKKTNLLETGNVNNDKTNESFSKSEIIWTRNKSVKIEMAQELAEQGLPDDVIRRLLRM